MTFINHTADRL